tara:strand:+ start:436 stop:597 length:162 start_codon:yes stop_codon:yes gene_type:complete
MSIATISLKDISNKKAAKKLIKLAKKHPNLYTQSDVLYAKMIKRVEKRKKQNK